MAMLGSSALSGIANIGGAFMSAGGAAAQNETVRQNNQQMQQNYQQGRTDTNYYFEENWKRQNAQADSVWQRAVKDMKLAGINPMLSYQKGGNPAASAVNAGQVAAPTLAGPPANPGAEMGRGIANSVSSALQAAHTVQNFSNLDANIKKTQAETSRTKAEEIKTVADTEISREMVKNPDVYRHLMRAQEHAAKEAAGASGAQAGLSRSQTTAVEQDARRKEQFGDSIIGNNLNSVQQMLKHLFGTLHNRGGGNTASPTARQLGGQALDSANRGADRLWGGIKSMFGGR